jgi:hypothetical protein
MAPQPDTTPELGGDTEFENGYIAAQRFMADQLRQMAHKLDGRSVQSRCRCGHGPGYHAPHCHALASMTKPEYCDCERYWNTNPDGAPDPSHPPASNDSDHIADVINAMLHRPWGSAPCTTGCTHVISGSWTALGVANVLRRHTLDPDESTPR